MPPIAGQKRGTPGTECGKILNRILEVGKAAFECLLDDGIIHRKYRHKLLEVAQHFMSMLAGNLFSQDVEKIGKGE